MPIRPENRGRYPQDWQQIRDDIVVRRAGGRCECTGECGRPHLGRCPERDRTDSVIGRPGLVIYLTVAHLDHVPEHNGPSNLRAMCQGCHLLYDLEHHLQTRRAREHRERVDAGQLLLLPGSTGLTPPDPPAGTSGSVRRLDSTAVPGCARGAGGQAFGLFADIDDVQQLPLERAAARRGLEAALDRRRAARRELELADAQLRAAVAVARDAGARVTQLAAAVSVSRPTIYEWLRAEASAPAIAARERSRSRA